jgi:hypothetical protein
MSKIELAPEQHRQRHIELHRAFDELAADFLTHNKGRLMSETSIMELAQWSHQQTLNPAEVEVED